MHWTRRASPYGAMACALVALLGGCREPYPTPRFRGAGAQTPTRGGTFRFAFDTDVRSLDPHIAYDAVSGAGLHLVYETLVDYAPGTTELVPSLATRWDVSADGREYTFHLRDGVRFHNGRRFTADDVRRSFERMLDPRRVPCPGTSFYRLIDGFDEFQAHTAPHVRGIAVLDPFTVRFRLTQADQTFLNIMAMPFAAAIAVEATEPASCANAHDEAARFACAARRDQFSRAPVGTGPYRLERWEQGARLVFARNESYWRPGRPYLDRIVLEMSLARHLQFMRFQHGDLEYAHNLSISTADHVWVHQQPSWRPYIQDGPDIAMYGISMNAEIPPWNNVHLRRAVALAIDRETMCRSRNYRIRPLGGVFPPGLPGYDEHLPNAQHYDIPAARREMALAGYPHGLPGEHEFWMSEGPPAMIYGGLIQADLARIGVNIRLRIASFAVFLENTERRHAVPMSFSAWSQDFPDPSNFTEILFHTRSIQDENSQNPSFYSNRVLDDLLDRARVEPSRSTRTAMYQQAERMIVDDAPWAFVYYPVNTEITQPYVHNYVTHPVWAYSVGDAWLDLPRRRWAERARRTRANWSGLAALALPWRWAP